MHTKTRKMMPMRKLLAMIGLALLLTASLGAVVSATPTESSSKAPTPETHHEIHSEVGVLIVSVVPDSPADEAGISRGDIVLAVDDEPVNDAESFAAAIVAHAEGDEVVLTVLHGDDTLELPTVLGDRSGRTFLGVVPYIENPESIEDIDAEESDDVDNETDGDGDVQDDDGDMAHDEDEDADEDDTASSPRQTQRSMIPLGLGGAMVMDVVDGSPADEAGLVVGDIIVAVDSEELTADVNLAELIGSYAPGDEVVLTIHNIESNETMEIPVTLAVHPNDVETAFLGIAYAPAPTFSYQDDDEGAEMAEGDDETIEEPEDDENAQDQGTQGSHVAQGSAMIADVVDGGPADEAGLVVGDLIVAIDGEELGEDADLAELIGSFAPGDEVLLTVHNAESNETMEIPITLGAHPDDEERAFLGIAYAIAPTFAPQDGNSSQNSAADETEDEEASEEADEAGEEELGEEEESDGDATASPRHQQSETKRMGRGGAKIADIVDGGPADEAGLTPGDVIIAIDGETLTGDATLGDLIGSHAPGDEIVLTVYSIESRETTDVPVTLGVHPEDETKAFLGVAYVSALKLAPGSRHQRGPAPMTPRQGEEPKAEESQDDKLESEDGSGCFHGYGSEDHGDFHDRFHGKEGYEGHLGPGEHGGMKMPFSHHGMDGHGLEGFDFDQLSEEDLDALHEMFPFLFPDDALERKSESESGL